jgi:hypothetical protein
MGLPGLKKFIATTFLIKPANDIIQSMEVEMKQFPVIGKIRTGPMSKGEPMVKIGGFK